MELKRNLRGLQGVKKRLKRIQKGLQEFKNDFHVHSDHSSEEKRIITLQKCTPLRINMFAWYIS